ncbi:MAG: hypothetical protein ACR2F6_13880 [Mycobacteriales bacterium]
MNQNGPVWYVARIAGPKVSTGTRHCAVPRDKALLLFVGAVVDDYPCPDPNFRPAPGQSLFDFLIADAKPYLDAVNSLMVSLDDRAVHGVMRHRYQSDNLFSLKADPSMIAPLGDPCLTGDWQPAVLDGYFLMFRPLPVGRHVIHVHGMTTTGDDKTFTYYLTVY